MTVEIKELTMSARIIKEGCESSGQEQEGGISEEKRDELVSECVEQVLKILSTSKER